MKRVPQTVVLELGGRSVSCNFIYSGRARYIRMQMSSLKGFEVVIPNGVNVNRVKEFIREHQKWVLKKLPQTEKSYKLFGNELFIETRETAGQKNFHIEYREGKLHITGPEFTRRKIDILYNAWLYSYSKNYLTRRITELAENNDFHFNKVTVRRQSSRWGSCSAKKNISLNYKLLWFSREVIDYVIFHELCHLKEMNHSAKFWKLVERYIPDYKKLTPHLHLR